jgi:hypothetical protein
MLAKVTVARFQFQFLLTVARFQFQFLLTVARFQFQFRECSLNCMQKLL